MATSLLFGERSLTMVAAVFDQAQQARTAAEQVLHDSGLPAQQVKVMGPGDPAVESKLEPEDKGIFRTLVKAHVTLGIAGLIGGLLLAGVLILVGAGFAVSSPFYTFFVAGLFGLFAGGMFGGLMTARPDHDVVIAKVEEAVHEGHWAVVVHPLNHDQEKRAEEVLQHTGGEVVHSL